MNTCGCRRGTCLCPEAERLWAATGDTYRVAMQTQKPEDWAVYDAAMAAYYAHMGREEGNATT